MSGRVLVTGGAGFAGGHLVALLAGEGARVAAPSREALDLLDARSVRGAVREVQPEAVFHLAALASVGRSWAAPAAPLLENLEMTLNVLEAVRLEAPDATLLIAGSAEVYGSPESLPVEESAPLRPQSPYAVSKAACDLLGGQYADAHELRVVRTRAFNHAGPGQPDDYVVSTLARQVAEAELAGQQQVVLRTGNVESRRDFTDVRDVVRAYRDAAGLAAGVWNVCSGRSWSVAELIDLLRAGSTVEVGYEVDPERQRAHDVPEVRGSAERLRKATGWEPEIPLEQTVRDALEDWRTRLGQAATRS